MKRILLALTLMFVLSLPSTYAQAGVYAGIDILGSFQGVADVSGNASGNPDSEFTFGGSLSLGYDFYYTENVPLRVELEYAIRSMVDLSLDYEQYVPLNGAFFPVKDDRSYNYSVQTLFVNGYFDIHNSTPLTPYIGVGIGAGFIDNVSRGGGVETVLAWNIGLGVAYAFTENFAIDLGYRFVGLGSNDVSSVSYIPYSNDFMLGARFTF